MSKCNCSAAEQYYYAEAVAASILSAEAFRQGLTSSCHHVSSSRDCRWFPLSAASCAAGLTDFFWAEQSQNSKQKALTPAWLNQGIGYTLHATSLLAKQSWAAMTAPPTSALIVKRPWAELLIQGDKRWELRSCSTTKRGRIAVAAGGTQTLLGEIDLVDCVKVSERGRSLLPLPLESFEHLHKVPDLSVLNYQDKSIFAWVMANPCPYSPVKTFVRDRGPVVWVSLPQDSQGAEMPNSANVSKKRKRRSS